MNCESKSFDKFIIFIKAAAYYFDTCCLPKLAPFVGLERVSDDSVKFNFFFLSNFAYFHFVILFQVLIISIIDSGVKCIVFFCKVRALLIGIYIYH